MESAAISSASWSRTATKCGSMSPLATSGTPTSCAASPNGRPTSFSWQKTSSGDSRCSGNRTGSVPCKPQRPAARSGLDFELRFLPALHEVHRRLERKRLREPIALDEFTTQLAQLRRLLRRLNAFGNHLHPQVARQPED